MSTFLKLVLLALSLVIVTKAARKLPVAVQTAQRRMTMNRRLWKHGMRFARMAQALKQPVQRPQHINATSEGEPITSLETFFGDGLGEHPGAQDLRNDIAIMESMEVKS